MLMRIALSGLAAFFFAVVSLVPQPALAHGNFDQSIEGDPGCNTSNFAASTTASSGQRQTFVPTGSQLISVALCVSASAANTPLVVAIYTSGGTLIGGGSTANNPSIPDAAGPPVRYVHVDFLQPYTVTPGATYIIENNSGTPITWYGTGAGSPYSYCHGAPNTSAVGDYGFQSYLADSPAASEPCPEPPTATSVPPTNTAVPQSTNTAAPGATAVPVNTPLPGTTPAPQPTLPAGTTSADAESAPAATSGAPARSSSGGTGVVRAGTTLPRSGHGPTSADSSATLAFVLATGGLALLALGFARQRQHP
jgi:hypothetical protein